jgi:hypothetical protein
MTKQLIREDTESTLVFYPSLENYIGTLAPSGHTVTLKYPGGGELAASQAATVDYVGSAPAIPLTLDTAAAKGTTTISYIDATTGPTDGNKYVARDSNGNKAVVTAQEVDTINHNIVLAEPLPFALAVGNTISAYRLSVTITAAQAATRGQNYQALWSYIFDATTTYYETQLFDIVSELDVFPTTLSDVTKRWLWIDGYLRSTDQDALDLMADTWTKRLQPMLKAKGLDIAKVRDKAQLIPLHVALINDTLASNRFMAGDGDYQAQRDEAAAEVNEIMNGITTSITWYDADDDLGAGDEEQNVMRSTQLRF